MDIFDFPTYRLHELAELFPYVEEEALQDLAADIREHGQHEPILLWNGEVVDGKTRLEACGLAEVAPIVQEIECETFEEVLDLVISRNLRRRHMSASQRALMAAKLSTFQRPDVPDWRHRCRELAFLARPELRPGAQAAPNAEPLPEEKGASIDARAPGASIDAREAGASIDAPGIPGGKWSELAGKAFNVGSSSVERATNVIKHGIPELVAAVERDEIAVSAAAKIAKLEPDDQRAAVEAVTSGAARSGAQAIRQVSKPHVARSTGNNEWYTPPKILEAAREVLGEIDLDPASCEVANQLVQATRVYTLEDDGLAQRWSGRVWLNPPYQAGVVDRFVAKLLEEEDVDEAIVFVNNATETAWAQTLARASSAVCLLAGRTKFLGADLRPKKTPLQGQVVYYIGPRPKPFADSFEPLGAVFFR